VAAYANANPQVAAQWSANISSWGKELLEDPSPHKHAKLTPVAGSGNTFSNELYFIGTRPNPTGAPICGNMPSNPTGTFTLQVYPDGQYVSASASNTNLIANTNAAGAVTFTSEYLPNAGTLQLVSTGQFITADISGNFALSASRTVASTWETFIVRPKVGAPSGVYSIKASSNGLYIVIQSDGSLRNSGGTEASSTGFFFHS
jgi:endo-1,3(4)-beta-glucanase